MKTIIKPFLGILLVATFSIQPISMFGADTNSSDATRIRSLTLTIHNAGITFGDEPVVHGIRINYKDRNLRRVNGINMSMLSPNEIPNSKIRGLALGLPVTAAGSMKGLTVALGGIAATESLSGFSISGFGFGVGGNVSGVSMAGFGFGAGENVTGLSLAGLGFGVGKNLTGVSLAGFGFGAGENITGLSLAGFGFGAGKNITGVSFTGLGVGAGGNIYGFSISGLGTRSGESVQGMHFAGLRIESTQLRGFTVSSTAKAEFATGLFIAPVYMHIEPEGKLNGVSISTFNYIQGYQYGLAIGLFNYTHNLRGVQIGILNYAGNKPGLLRILPLMNAHL